MLQHPRLEKRSNANLIFRRPEEPHELDSLVGSDVFSLESQDAQSTTFGSVDTAEVLAPASSRPIKRQTY